MYERLDANGMTGLIAPSYYGLFHTLLPSGDDTDWEDPFDDVEFPRYPRIPGWKFDRFQKFEDHPEGAAYMPYDLAREEEYQEWTEDPSASYTSSHWRTFTETRNTPALTVLLLERIGEKMALEDYYSDK